MTGKGLPGMQQQQPQQSQGGAGFMGNSAIPPYLKWCAAAILMVTYLAALADAIYVSIFRANMPLPTDVSIVLGTGLGIALQLLGAHTGASLSNESPHPGMVPAPPPPQPPLQLPQEPATVGAPPHASAPYAPPVPPPGYGG